MFIRRITDKSFLGNSETQIIILITQSYCVIKSTGWLRIFILAVDVVYTLDELRHSDIYSVYVLFNKKKNFISR